MAKTLEESAANRDDLKKQTEELAQEVLLLQKQCTTTANYIKQHNCAQKKLLDQNQNAKDDINVNKLPLDNNDSNIAQIVNLDDEFKILEDTLLNSNQISVMNCVKQKIHLYIDRKLLESKAERDEELKTLKEKLENEKNEYDSEMNRLQELLLGVKSKDLTELRKELETKHAKEVEDLRTYFEQKCSELEKQ